MTYKAKVYEIKVRVTSMGWTEHLTVRIEARNAKSIKPLLDKMYDQCDGYVINNIKKC